ncbi:MAG: hypothetical protein SH850_08420 [Planctomycetaceae bacterium]|nr:hypothetical protein [Planctomycetaceae bacterium]
MTSSVLLGTHIHSATGDAARRQIRAMTGLRDLCPMTPVNLQFADRVNLQELDGFDTLAVLQQDSNSVTGQPGVRKPVVSELFTRLAEAAVQRGARYFGFTNSDIVFTPAAIDRIQQGDRPAYVFARTDFEPGTEQNTRSLIYGTDVFAVDASWWLSHRRRFRPYIVGESCWDNVYTAQLLCWAGGLLLNREPLVRHEAHPAVWRKSPFAEHNGYLAALDRLYFTRWAIYADRLEKLRLAAGGLADERDESRLQDEVFRDWKPTVANHVLQTLRLAKLKTRSWLRR